MAACAWHATAIPSRARIWDERYSLRNVEYTIRKPELKPNYPYYPNLSHMPHTAVLAVSHGIHKLTGWETWAVLEPRSGLTPHGYRLARWTSTLFVGGALCLTFLLGRRVFNAEVALMGVLLLATSTLVILSGGIAKPDAPLLFFMLLAFLWSLDAAKNGSWRSYLLAGLGVGLAASTKQTGALVSMATILATVLHYREPARWIRLAGAGVASLATFVLFHPWPGAWDRYVGTVRVYSNWTNKREVKLEKTENLLDALAFLPKLILDERYNGLILGALALIGFCVLVVLALRKAPGFGREELALFVGFPICFLLVTALVSTHHRPNVFISMLPFSSLAAAWLIRELWRWLAARLPAGARRLLFWPALLGFLAIAVVPAAQYVASEATRETPRRALKKEAKRQAKPPAPPAQPPV